MKHQLQPDSWCVRVTAECLCQGITVLYSLYQCIQINKDDSNYNDTKKYQIWCSIFSSDVSFLLQVYPWKVLLVTWNFVLIGWVEWMTSTPERWPGTIMQTTILSTSTSRCIHATIPLHQLESAMFDLSLPALYLVRSSQAHVKNINCCHVQEVILLQHWDKVNLKVWDWFLIHIENFLFVGITIWPYPTALDTCGKFTVDLVKSHGHSHGFLHLTTGSAK